MLSLLRSTIGRLLAGPIAAVIAWLALPGPQAEDLKAAIILGVTLSIYGVGHKLLDRIGLNPDDGTGSGGSS